MPAAVQVAQAPKVVVVPAKVAADNNADKADNVVLVQAAQAVTETGTAAVAAHPAVMLLRVVVAAVVITAAAAVVLRAVTATAEPVVVVAIVQDKQQLQAVGVAALAVPADYGLDHMDSVISQAEL
jgi:hypothetical protein